MGIWYYGVMLYGIEVSTEQRNELIMKTLGLKTEEEAEEWNDNNGFSELEIKKNPELTTVSLSYSYDGDRHEFLAIKTTYHQSKMYDCKKIDDHFEVNYKHWDELLSQAIGLKVQGNWFVMSEGD